MNDPTLNCDENKSSKKRINQEKHNYNEAYA